VTPAADGSLPPDPKLRFDPPDPHARLDFSARSDHQRLRDQLDQAQAIPPWQLAGLVVVGRQWCEHCHADHDAYGLTP
jgi:hypothetical protein